MKPWARATVAAGQKRLENTGLDYLYCNTLLIIVKYFWLNLVRIVWTHPNQIVFYADKILESEFSGKMMPNVPREVLAPASFQRGPPGQRQLLRRKQRDRGRPEEFECSCPPRIHPGPVWAWRWVANNPDLFEHQRQFLPDGPEKKITSILGTYYWYITDNRPPLSDSLSVQNLSRHTSLRGPICMDNEPQGMYR